ncbi:MAG: restriction endonuclease subunit S [Patescibacteria group bacterium]|nr:restriction endonuclease subunit S [Patescibacteria group bacterium]
MPTQEIKNQEWEIKKIKDLGLVSTGSTPSTSQPLFYGGEYKLISPADLTESKYIFTSHKLLTDEGLGVARKVPANSILVGCIGNVGKIGMTTDDVSAFNQQINAVQCNENNDPNFVYYLLKYQKPVLESKAAKVTLPILNKNNFENIEVLVPSLSEQKSIVHALSTVQGAIEGQEKLIEKLKDLKRSMMNHFFIHGTKNEPTKMTEIGEIPEGWEVVELGRLSEIQQGKQVSKKNRIGENQKPFLRTANVFWNKIDLSELDEMNFSKKEEEKYHLNYGDLLICEGGDVGRTAMWRDEMQDCYYQNHLHRVRVGQKISSLFLLYWLDYALNNTDVYLGRANNTTIPNLSKSKLQMFEIPLPKIEEQNIISAALQAIDQKIESTQQKLLNRQSLFKTLLHELMSGERRIR